MLRRCPLLHPLPACRLGTVREGRIVTGSVFVDVPGKASLAQALAASGLGEPEAVEMECAGVAQVRDMSGHRQAALFPSTMPGGIKEPTTTGPIVTTCPTSGVPRVRRAVPRAACAVGPDRGRRQRRLQRLHLRGR